MEFPLVWLFLSAFVASVIAMPLARRFGAAIGLMDHPHQRKLQSSAVPRTGGIGILLGLVAGMGVLIGLSPFLGVPIGRDLFAICVGGILIHATGVLDDLWDIPARLKLLAQALAVACVLSQGVYVENIVLPGGNVIQLGWAGIPLTAFFLLGLVNSINLVDGLDGLASGISCIAALALALAGVLTGNAVLTGLALILLGSVLSFLPYNLRSERKIFLGDAGSMLLGWMLGVVAITGSRFGADSTGLFVLLAAVAVPIFDTATTIVRRARSEGRLFHPDSMHIHHRLIRFGMTPRQTVFTILAMTLFAAGQSLVLLVEGTRALLIPTTLAVVLVVLQVRRPRQPQPTDDQDEASFREILLYLLGAQKGTGPRMSGELAIVDLLREATEEATPGVQSPSVVTAQAKAKANAAKVPAAPPSEREPAPVRAPETR